jgi:hypothetical protein
MLYCPWECWVYKDDRGYKDDRMGYKLGRLAGIGCYPSGIVG